MRSLFTNPSLYVLQTKLVSPNSQGNSRWTVVNPVASTLYGAIGKDEYPKLIKILRDASSAEGEALHDVEILTEKSLLLPEPNCSVTKKGSVFLDYYHSFVHGYVFHNYDSIERFEKDREQMNEYGKIARPPDVYTQRNAELKRLNLPLPQMHLCSIESEVQLLSNILSGTFLAVGEINGGDFGPWLRKANPSGGARHPIEALVIINGVENIPDGVYCFDPPNNQLVYKMASSDGSNHRRLSLVLTARVERPMWRYRESRSFRAIFLDAGHCIETLRQLSAAYGWSLMEGFIDQNVFNEFDLQDIPICGFSISRPVGRMASEATLQTTSDIVACEREDFSRSACYNTNPFLWCYFAEGKLVGVTSYPKCAKLILDESMFRVLNYAQVSRRGDRPSTPLELSLSQNVSINLVDELIQSGFLVNLENVRSLYSEAAHWISHGWYQNLLVYLEYKAEKINSESLIGENFFHESESVEPGPLWKALSTERKTTRIFSPTLIDPISAFGAVSSCLELLNDCDALEMFHLKRVNDDMFKVQRWSKKERCFINFKEIESALLENAVIGQKPVVQASDIYWFASSVEGLNSVGYVNALLRLGMLMQKVCISCARMKLGLFITPASNDLTAAKITELNSVSTLNYFAAVGRAVRK
ncbi:SagB/ThcOx family dehydrogenase [Pseudomonas sp. W4I3]|uniref:SagB/ThcOx family dehydrogenase n=1 Tax=Pseudomonas sp. W4I3 TaxID=3042294 RepID=UPI0027855519|nr:SagB/ThcOx family dehydrogenase [Pseudomonas sp. W4I3]MDQ0740594.1 hypothetical protein [Pseudomonas sp. W4I3]